MNLTKYLQSQEFRVKLFSATKQIMSVHLKENRGDVPYIEYGTKREVRLKQIQHYLTNFYTVLDDLDLAIFFLEKERSLILEHYPKLEYQITYYKYHHENYFIRIATLNDIVGKMGNLIYKLELNMNYCSLYNFKDKAKSKGYEKISSIAERLIEKLKLLKQHRNEKLHTGETDLEPLNSITIWEEVNTKRGFETSKALIEDTNQEIQIGIEELKSLTIEMINIVTEFLDESVEKLIEIIDDNG